MEENNKKINNNWKFILSFILALIFVIGMLLTFNLNDTKKYKQIVLIENEYNNGNFKIILTVDYHDNVSKIKIKNKSSSTISYDYIYGEDGSIYSIKDDIDVWGNDSFESGWKEDQYYHIGCGKDYQYSSYYETYWYYDEDWIWEINYTERIVQFDGKEIK